MQIGSRIKTFHADTAEFKEPLGKTEQTMIQRREIITTSFLELNNRARKKESCAKKNNRL